MNERSGFFFVFGKKAKRVPPPHFLQGGRMVGRLLVISLGVLSVLPCTQGFMRTPGSLFLGSAQPSLLQLRKAGATPWHRPVMAAGVQVGLDQRDRREASKGIVHAGVSQISSCIPPLVISGPSGVGKVTSVLIAPKKCCTKARSTC